MATASVNSRLKHLRCEIWERERDGGKENISLLSTALLFVHNVSIHTEAVVWIFDFEFIDIQLNILTVVSIGGRIKALLNRNTFPDACGISAPSHVSVPVNSSMKQKQHQNTFELKLNRQLRVPSNLLIGLYLRDFCQYHCQLECTQRRLSASIRKSTKMFPIHFLFRIRPGQANHSFLVCICMKKYGVRACVRTRIKKNERLAMR